MKRGNYILFLFMLLCIVGCKHKTNVTNPDTKTIISESEIDENFDLSSITRIQCTRKIKTI